MINYINDSKAATDVETIYLITELDFLPQCFTFVNIIVCVLTALDTSCSI